MEVDAAAILSDSKRDTWKYTCFDSWKWENLRTLIVLGA